MVVKRGKALTQLHRPVILPNDENDDEEAHRGENPTEQILRRDESATVFRSPMEAVRRTCGAVAVSLEKGGGRRKEDRQ